MAYGTTRAIHHGFRRHLVWRSYECVSVLGPRKLMAFDGRCVFGQVHYRLTRRFLNAAHCCCSICRRAHGTGFSTHVAAGRTSLDSLPARSSITSLHPLLFVLFSPTAVGALSFRVKVAAGISRSPPGPWTGCRSTRDGLRVSAQQHDGLAFGPISQKLGSSNIDQRRLLLFGRLKPSTCRGSSSRTCCLRSACSCRYSPFGLRCSALPSRLLSSSAAHEIISTRICHTSRRR